MTAISQLWHIQVLQKLSHFRDNYHHLQMSKLRLREGVARPQSWGFYLNNNAGYYNIENQIIRRSPSLTGSSRLGVRVVVQKVRWEEAHICFMLVRFQALGR